MLFVSTTIFIAILLLNREIAYGLDYYRGYYTHRVLYAMQYGCAFLTGIILASTLFILTMALEV